MHKLNTWLLKHMFWIALYLAISGIFFQLVLFYELLNSGSRWIYVVFDFTYGHLNFFNADVLNFKFYTDESSYRMRSYLDIVFYVLFLLAALVYKLSNYKVSAVLRFCFSLTFLFSIIGMLFQLYLLGFKFERIGFLSVLYFIKALMLCYICYLYLITWKSQRTYIDTETMSLPNFKTFTLERAVWYQRLVHYLLDLFLIGSIFSQYVIYSYYFGTWVEVLEDEVGERFAASIVFIIFSSIYFLLFEGLFKSTPAKYLSETSVVSLNNKPVSFNNVLGRTLCRHIPFDAFSFFGKIGWHDSLSYTTVAKHKREPSKFKAVYIVFVILLIALFLYTVIDEYTF